MSPGYGVVIRPEPRQLAGWQIRMSVPFMLSIDYLYINAHPRLPPTRSARGSVTIFTLPQGFRLRPAGYAETGRRLFQEGTSKKSLNLNLASRRRAEF